LLDWRIALSKKHYIIPIFVPHEGCPHNCVFCNQEHITGSENTKDNIEVNKIDDKYVKETIEEYLKTIDAIDSTIEVSFFGGTFTAINIEKQKLLLSVAKAYKEMGKINHIRLSTRPDYIDIDILENLKAYSVDIIELGVQSMDEEVLLKSGRGHIKEDVSKASKLIKEYGFTLGHQVMLGLPGDTPQKDIKTVEQLLNLKPDMFRIYPALVIKDTPMEILYNSKNYSPYSIETAVSVSKDLLCMISSKDIKVIRIGLQPTDNIAEGKDIVAGPFHPAFRELVEGSLYCDMILDFAKNLEGNLLLKVNYRDISKLYANKKQFFKEVKNQLQKLDLQVSSEADVERKKIYAEHLGKCYILSINDYIKKKAEEGKSSVS
jgi:histone acetyltransferase (RNA polymerase elongator complex component)